MRTADPAHHTNNRSRAVTAFLALALTLGPAAGLSEQVIGVGRVYWSTLTSITADTTACVEASSDAAAKCALFPAGTIEGNWKLGNFVVSQAVADTIACWALEPDATIDTAKLEIGSTERGACFPLSVSGITSARPSWTDLADSGAFAATGICSLPIGGTAAEAWQNGAAGDSLVYAPCAVDADCETNHGTSLAAATCTARASTTPTQRANVGAYLLLESSSTTTVRVWKERLHTF